MALRSASSSLASVESGRLLRGALVLSLCSVRPLVRHGEALTNTAYSVWPWLVDTALRKTFFGHFCAGTDAEDVQPTVQWLKERGVGPILDYAAEAEPAAAAATAADRNQPARTYTYQGEDEAEARLDVFLDAVRAAAASTSESEIGYAAVKLTALTEPQLLERMSVAVSEGRTLFDRFAGVAAQSRSSLAGRPTLTRAEFGNAYREFFSGGGDGGAMSIDGLVERLDPNGLDAIDRAEWVSTLRLEEITPLCQRCRHQGKLASAALDPEELLRARAFARRLRAIADAAAASDVRLMIDAEQTW